MGVRRWLKWPLVLAALCALLLVAGLVHKAVLAERTDEEDQDRPAPPTHELRWGPERADAYGIKDRPAREISWQPTIVAYGRVVPNPRAVVEVRSALAGHLRQSQQAWPVPGIGVKAGQILGHLDVRVGPPERLDMEIKLKEAYLKKEGAEKVLAIQKDRLKQLEAASVSVSRAELDLVRVQIIQTEKEMETAQAAVKLWRKALDESTAPSGRKGSRWSLPLTTPINGEVTDVSGAPGTAVEAGALVARIADFRKPLVRLELPADSVNGGAPARLALSRAGAPRRTNDDGASASPVYSFWATLTGQAPYVDAASQLAVYWYEVDLNGGTGSEMWRPGLFVKAELRASGSGPHPAVIVPPEAIVYHDGKPLVYIRTAPGNYQRRQVRVLARQGEDLIVEGIQAGERVVWQQAQLLLSDEFQSKADDD